jgi:hypothetical protein
MFKEVDQMNVAALRGYCKENDLHGYNRLRKTALLILVKQFILKKSITKGLEQLLAIK